MSTRRHDDVDDVVDAAPVDAYPPKPTLACCRGLTGFADHRRVSVRKYIRRGLTDESSGLGGVSPVVTTRLGLN